MKTFIIIVGIISIIGVGGFVVFKICGFLKLMFYGGF